MRYEPVGRRRHKGGDGLGPQKDGAPVHADRHRREADHSLQHLVEGSQRLGGFGHLEHYRRDQGLLLGCLVDASVMAIFCVILGFNLIADGLRDAMDPYMRNR